MNKATRSNNNLNATNNKPAGKPTCVAAKPTFESLEDRRLMSNVTLVDGMLILQGNQHGNNRLTVSPDSNGTTLFARANDKKAHYLLKDVKSIRIVGGDKRDNVVIDAAIKRNAYVRTGEDRDFVSGGGGSDTVFGGHEPDTLMGNGGDDLLLGGGQGADKVDAGSGDDPTKVWPRKSTDNPVSVTSFTLIDATTDNVLGTLSNNSTLNLAALPSKVNVRANLSDANYDGSVRFSYDGVDLGTIENTAPWALAGDSEGNYKGWEPRVGTHTLKATPYAGKNAAGAAGTELLVTFRVVDDPGAIGQDNNDTEPPPPPPPPPPNDGGDTGGDTDTPNQANAPTANITVLDSTVAQGMAIHVNGLGSTLKVGDPIGAKYEWNFGDAGSKYNTLVGFNAAHAYTKAGTYTITLKVTNSAGASDTVTTQVTIAPAGRRFVYVSPNGNDANNGSSVNLAVKTFKRAGQLVGDNCEILFERGATYTTSSSMGLGHDNVVVGAYGSGADPVIKYTNGADYGTIFSTLGAMDVLVHDITFDSTNTSTGDQGYNDAVRIGGQNVTVRDCTFLNVGYGVNTNGFPDGVLVQDNVAPNANSIRAYLAWVQGSDHVYLGNVAKDSLHAHNLRVGGADRVNIAYNDFTNLTTTAGYRGTLTIHKGSYITVTNNKLTDGCLFLGPLDAGAALDDKAARLKWVLVENNVLNSQLKIAHGTEHVQVRDNVFNLDNDAAINILGWSDQYDRGVKDVYIVHNTGINNGEHGKFIRVGGAVDGVTVTNNLYVAPKFVTGSYDSAPMQICNSDLTGFRDIRDNVWPMPTILQYADGGINYVGSSSGTAAYKTPAEWEAYGQVQHDQFKDVTLVGSYMVSLGGITAGADMTK